MKIIPLKILQTSLAFLCLLQFSFAQSKKESKTDQEIVAPTVSIARCDRTTKNAEAEKFCNNGLDLLIQQKFDQAIAAFTKAIELDPKYADAYNRRGDAYNQNKSSDLAIADLTKAIELSPNKVQLYVHRGSTYFVYEKKYELALADFTKAIELNPKNEFLYRMRAMIYDATGQRDLADADLRKAKELRSASKR